MGYQLTYTQHSGIDQQPLGISSPAVAPYGAFHQRRPDRGPRHHQRPRMAAAGPGDHRSPRPGRRPAVRHQRRPLRAPRRSSTRPSGPGVPNTISPRFRRPPTTPGSATPGTTCPARWWCTRSSPRATAGARRHPEGRHPGVAAAAGDHGFEPPMGAVPGLGEHTDAVLGELGLTADESPGCGTRVRSDRPTRERRRTGAAVRRPRRRPHADPEPARPQERDRCPVVAGTRRRARAAARDALRALVLTGAGGAFCSGADIGTARGHPPAAQVAPAHRCRAGVARDGGADRRQGDRGGRRRRLEPGAGLRLRGGDARIAVLPDLRQTRPVGGPRWLVAAAQAGRAAAGQAAGAARRHDRRRRGPRAGSGHLGQGQPTRSTASSTNWPVGWPPGRRSRWRRARRC